MADQSGSQDRSRRLDRKSLQPAQTPLVHRYDQPGRVRGPTHSDGTSRLTLCPPNGVKPTVVVNNPAPLRVFTPSAPSQSGAPAQAPAPAAAAPFFFKETAATEKDDTS